MTNQLKTSTHDYVIEELENSCGNCCLKISVKKSSHCFKCNPKFNHKLYPKKKPKACLKIFVYIQCALSIC